MEDRNGSGGINAGGREGRLSEGNADGIAHKSIERLRFIVSLNPFAQIERVAVYDMALEDRLVRHQDLRAAIGQNAAHFGEREERVQRDRDSSGADNRQEPVKTTPVVAAINGDRLAGTERDHLTEKGVHAADAGVQFGEMKTAAV